jgi:hypothetical protein
VEPGLELDALVHELVLDKCIHTWIPGGLWATCSKCSKKIRLPLRGGVPDYHPPPYSTDIRWAWVLMEAQFKQGECLQIHPDIDGQWVVHTMRWTKNTDTLRIWDDTAFRPSYKCRTAPHAICIAAIDGLVDEEVVEQWDYDGIQDDIRCYEEKPDER